jgi:hypothetical protein
MSAQYPGFKEVTKEEFYAHIGPRNVHPRPVGKWSNEYGYKTEWVHQETGRIYGMSNKNAYFLHA